MPGKRKTTRRQFLSGHSAVEALGDLTHGTAENTSAAAVSAGSAASPVRPATYLIEVGRRAMACEFQVLLNAGRSPAATEAALEALDLVDELEAQLTVYREESEVSQLNLHAAQGPVPVEPRLWDLLRLSVRLSEETAGAFDITSGPLSKVWGFYRRAGQLPQPDVLAQALARVGSWQLEFASAEADQPPTLRFAHPGVEINLGSIGKGYALDRCAQLLSARGVQDFLLHGGQSSVLARGRREDGQDHPGWSVGVVHPLRPERRVAELQVVDRAVGTSGSGTQFFQHQGRRYGHILDPRTGQPASGVLSSTVLAPTAALADALATACYVLGPQESLAYCRARPDLGLLLVVPAQQAGAVEIITHGLDDVDWRLLEP